MMSVKAIHICYLTRDTVMKNIYVNYIININLQPREDLLKLLYVGPGLVVQVKPDALTTI